jgi:hypothetical protein
MGYTGHVLHCAASEARNIDALFFMLGWDHYGFQKQHNETRYAELVFYIRWDLRATYYLPLRPGRKTSMHYFSCSAGTGTVSTKSVMGHVTPNLCLCIGKDSRNSAMGHVTPNLHFCIRWDLRVL